MLGGEFLVESIEGLGVELFGLEGGVAIDEGEGWMRLVEWEDGVGDKLVRNNIGEVKDTIYGIDYATASNFP